MPGGRRLSRGAALLAAGAAVAVAAGAAACGSSVPASRPRSAPRPHSAAPAPTACTVGQLVTTYAGTQGAPGHLELTLAVRNVSARSCRIRGYPAARLLDGRGRPLPLRVRDGHGFFPDTLTAPRPVLLAPGARAHFGISFVTNDEYAGARVCRVASLLLAAAPGRPGRRWSRIPLRGVRGVSGARVEPCGSELVVSPVHA